MRAAASGAAPGGADAVTATPADRADISAQGRLRTQAVDAVRATSGTRAALVAELRAQVQSGAYTVDEHRLAARLAQHVDLKA